VSVCVCERERESSKLKQATFIFLKIEKTKKVKGIKNHPKFSHNLRLCHYATLFLFGKCFKN